MKADQTVHTKRRKELEQAGTTWNKLEPGKTCKNITWKSNGNWLQLLFRKRGKSAIKNKSISEAYSEPCQTSNKKLFVKITNSLHPKRLYIRCMTGFWICLCICISKSRDFQFLWNHLKWFERRSGINTLRREIFGLLVLWMLF